MADCLLVFLPLSLALSSVSLSPSMSDAHLQWPVPPVTEYGEMATLVSDAKCPNIVSVRDLLQWLPFVALSHAEDSEEP